MSLFPSLNYKHLSVNHSENFVDPDTGVNTNLIENLWMRLKSTLRRKYQRNFQELEGYIAEFCWRKKYKGDTEAIFNALLKELSVND
jgi:hypothetical protein